MRQFYQYTILRRTMFKRPTKFTLTLSWFTFVGLYLCLYFFSLSCVLKVADEYTGGDKVAEFFSDLFVVVMMFPLNLFGLFEFTFNSEDTWFLIPLFIFSSVISCLTVSTILNFLFLRFAAFVKTVFLSRR